MEAKRQLTAEEESIRRNTDCIYFLASPLTCKKGSECEFRHSDVARLNPKECWYWMNSNCLNPKCGFRHPPLDGLFEKPRLPASHAGPYNTTNKQTIPCYYFQKGQCIKGDKCPFMHGSNPTTDNPSQQATTLPHEATPNDSQEAPNSHTISWALKECTTQLTPPKISIRRSISANKLSPPYPSLEYELPKQQPISSDSTSSKPPPPPVEEEYYTNGREAEDYLGESPGFDVLVDVDAEEYVPRDPEYYNSLSLDEFDYSHHSYGYEDVYNRQMHSKLLELKMRDLSPGGDTSAITGSDLRHGLLMKRRRLDDSEREARHGEYDRYGHGDRFSSRRDDARLPEEISISSRLQGRIKLPSNEFREGEKRRVRDRAKHAPPYAEKRRRMSRRDDVDSMNFPGPKSLAELKGAKFSKGSEASLVKKDEGEVDDFDGDDEDEGHEFQGVDEEDENACLDDDDDEFAKKVKGFFD